MRKAFVGLVLGFASACVSQDSVGVSELSITSGQALQGTNTQAGDGFGGTLAVSADGTTIAVGAADHEYQTGAVYVFTQVNGQWVEDAIITAADGHFSSTFGTGLALSRDGATLAVGAANASTVYVFAHSHAGWAQQAELTNSNGGWGSDVALSGDGGTLAIGSPSSNFGSGNVVLFTRIGRRWGLQQTIEGSGQFGSSLAFSGDGATLAVGSTLNAVRIYTLHHKLYELSGYARPSVSDPDDGLGFWSIAIADDGSAMAVGAPYEASSASGVNGAPTDNSMQYAGAAYLFSATPTDWTQTAYIKASNPDASDEFGFSVALSSTSLLVGAIGESSGIVGVQSDNSAPNAGAAYDFSSTGTVAQTAYVQSPTPTQYTQFGRTVATSADGGVIAIGHPNLNGGVVRTYTP